MDIVIKKPTVLHDIEDDELVLGSWYWVDNGEKPQWLGCITEIGTNYVAITSPKSNSSRYFCRVHFNEVNEKLTPELNAGVYIQQKIESTKIEISETLEEIKELTRRLGIGDRLYLDQSSSETKALAVVSSSQDIKQYELQLVKAKNEELPALFKKVREQNETLCMWMTAEALPLEAMSGNLQSHIKKVENRIFNVSLYAGLTEQCIQIQDGNPAHITEKLRVFQTVLFMDEECLINYHEGGMEFKDIGAFDQWLCKPENLKRILPFERTLVAMRVRRHEKERENNSIDQIFVNIELRQLDKLTFMYMRNGEQVFRMNCDLNFGEQLFPLKAIYDSSEPLRFRRFVSDIKKIITESTYQSLVEEAKEKERKHEEWKIAHPNEHHFFSPFDSATHGIGEWIPFNKDSVYFDDCQKIIDAQIQQYNRIVLILQGLFDRSPVFHPHLPVKTWTAEGFESAIQPIYDNDNIIEYGKAPDFNQYRSQCNLSLSEGSVTVGQELYWLKAEAKKENEKNCSHRSISSRIDYKFFQPYGNPGPGRLALISKWKKRSSEALFTWTRQKRHSFYEDPSEATIPCKINVPSSELFNVSAYKPGDYKQFFADPRTRKDYIQWANLLLTAEEYHAGRLKIGNHGKSPRW